ncbi:helix-turn-helix domain-containing protein [Salinisphaera sp. SWV1]|uniref:helix-turn-helix domain-containing protein n=1 Tax=Salinisphaera sp. SWV1 TaxID=3454139 RepID=UPI003F841FD4
MKVTTLKQLGAFIRDQRRQRKWTQKQLADASGTLQSWLSGVEKGKGNPEFGKLMAVLRALDVTLDLHRQSAEPKPVPRPNASPAQLDRASTVRRTASGGLDSSRRDAPSPASGGIARGSAQAPSVQSLRARFQKSGKK